MDLSHFPGTLGQLPLELVWSILDQLFSGTPKVTYSSLRVIRNLALTSTSAAAHIESYMANQSTLQLLRNAVDDAKWHPYGRDETIEHEGDRSFTYLADAKSDDCDVITGAIIDDCTTCFKWLRNAVPVLDGTGVNKNGWTFVAIAGNFQSLNMFKYFDTLQSPNRSWIQILTQPANIYQDIATALVVMSRQHNVKFLRAVFTILAPRLRELDHPSALDGRPTKEEQYLLCTFLTPELALEFEKVDMPLDNVDGAWPARGNAYHAGATNGPEFLEYLHGKSSLEKNARDSAFETPLHYAVRANRLDSVIWLNEHGAHEDYSESTESSAAQIAALSTTEESLAILKEVLPRPGLNATGFLSPGSMLVALVEGFKNATDVEVPRDITQLKRLHERIVIKKLEILVEASINCPDIMCSTEPDHGIPTYKMALTLARKDGVDKVATLIEEASRKRGIVPVIASMNS
ncbi:uncharacterized protein N7483_000144 [Penicillium malachiteum]|uniref:uncharacterized protein n=1 Tax=Penicillium malachiteum TaxID=1324776 RepID=UPI0025475168|nr:uncharacterized protein N7483_000144 [Penicillium malachiteum]KAJ5735019.1 hypothetical protein N7483_000144 [Penicillium malachiteum]